MKSALKESEGSEKAVGLTIEDESVDDMVGLPPLSGKGRVLLKNFAHVRYSDLLR